jgi:hypothetical protein
MIVGWLQIIRSQLHLMWSQNRDDCGLKRLVLWVATVNWRAIIFGGDRQQNSRHYSQPSHSP